MKFAKTTLALILSVLLMFSGTALCCAASPAIGGCNWMSVIDDSTSLADISMPGTHDSAATYLAFGIKARCQDKTIPAQLNCGARFLDIRLCAEKNKLKLVHNFVDCRKGSGFTAPRLYLDDVLEYCADFLGKNEKECIVLFVKEDFGTSAEFDTLLQKYIQRNKELWYTENRVPSLGEVRGKLVLMNRYSKAESKVDEKTGGINLSNFPRQGDNNGSYQAVSLDSYSGKMISTYMVQDRYNYPKEEKWERAVAPTLAIEKTEDQLLINFLSTAAGLSPEINAAYVNAQLLDYDLNQKACYGAVLFDFITPELAAKIYNCNAAVINSSYTPTAGVAADVPEAQNGFIPFLDFVWSWLIQLFS
ncbi:MAG: hypothetical protein E7517_02590 [Ruminococcaceae bacterium]|nr:hypothetical protein [Oscillospiraceae bacterium]